MDRLLKKKWFTIVSVISFVLVANISVSQVYEDDVYYTPSKDSKSLEEKRVEKKPHLDMAKNNKKDDFADAQREYLEMLSRKKEAKKTEKEDFEENSWVYNTEGLHLKNDKEKALSFQNRQYLRDDNNSNREYEDNVTIILDVAPRHSFYRSNFWFDWFSDDMFFYDDYDYAYMRYYNHYRPYRYRHGYWDNYYDYGYYGASWSGYYNHWGYYHRPYYTPYYHSYYPYSSYYYPYSYPYYYPYYSSGYYRKSYNYHKRPSNYIGRSDYSESGRTRRVRRNTNRDVYLGNRRSYSEDNISNRRNQNAVSSSRRYSDRLGNNRDILKRNRTLEQTHNNRIGTKSLSYGNTGRRSSRIYTRPVSYGNRSVSNKRTYRDSRVIFDTKAPSTTYNNSRNTSSSYRRSPSSTYRRSSSSSYRRSSTPTNNTTYRRSSSTPQRRNSTTSRRSQKSTNSSSRSVTRNNISNKTYSERSGRRR